MCEFSNGIAGRQSHADFFRIGRSKAAFGAVVAIIGSCAAFIVPSAAAEDATPIADLSGYFPRQVTNIDDDFDRPDSDTVGNGWIELRDGDADDIRITSNRVQVSGNTRAAIAKDHGDLQQAVIETAQLSF